MIETFFFFRLKEGFISKSLFFLLTVRIVIIKEVFLPALAPQIVFAS